MLIVNVNMKFFLQPEQSPQQRMQTLSIDEILQLAEQLPGDRPALENYFSPTRKEAFIKDFLHYINSCLLDARHGEMDRDLYLLFVMTFQFVTSLLEIRAEKEFGLFYRILEKNYGVEEIDLNLHFALDGYDRGMVREEEALRAFREELDDSYGGRREVKDRVQKQLKQDAIDAIIFWQKEESLPALAEAFGRSIVIPSFFDFTDKKLVRFYRSTTEGITYRVAVPEELE